MVKWVDMAGTINEGVPAIVDEMLGKVTSEFPSLQETQLTLIRDMAVHSAQQTLTHLGETLERNSRFLSTQEEFLMASVVMKIVEGALRATVKQLAVATMLSIHARNNGGSS